MHVMTVPERDSHSTLELGEHAGTSSKRQPAANGAAGHNHARNSRLSRPGSSGFARPLRQPAPERDLLAMTVKVMRERERRRP
jgi:hypothetical protein